MYIVLFASPDNEEPIVEVFQTDAAALRFADDLVADILGTPADSGWLQVFRVVGTSKELVKSYL
jgi:hypothetical protein